MSNRHQARNEPPPPDKDVADVVYRDSFDLVDLMSANVWTQSPPDAAQLESRSMPVDQVAAAGPSVPLVPPSDVNDPATESIHLPGGPPQGWRHPSGGPPTQEPMTALVTFGMYARRSRYFVHLSQERLSGDSGVSQSMISRLERGLAPGMRIDHVVMLSESLGRALPLGFCPHEHRCVWQPIEPPHSSPELDEAARRRERLIELGLDHPFGKRFPD